MVEKKNFNNWNLFILHGSFLEDWNETFWWCWWSYWMYFMSSMTLSFSYLSSSFWELLHHIGMYLGFKYTPLNNLGSITCKNMFYLWWLNLWKILKFYFSNRIITDLKSFKCCSEQDKICDLVGCICRYGCVPFF